MFSAKLLVCICKPQNVKALFATKPVGSLQISGIITRSYKSRVSSRKFIVPKTSKLVSVPTSRIFGAGQIAMATSGVVGLGALCCYGLGIFTDVGNSDTVGLWSPIVKQRIRDTYIYTALSMVTIAMAAFQFRRARSTLFSILRQSYERQPLVAVGTSIMIILIISSSMDIEPYYGHGFHFKQFLMLCTCGILGMLVYTLSKSGGSVMINAALITAGMISGLSAVAMCAQSQKFITWEAPVGMGLGAMTVASLWASNLNLLSVVSHPIYCTTVYGSVMILFNLILLQTQQIVREAETLSQENGYDPYDPILKSNIFGSMVYIPFSKGVIRIADFMADE